MGDGVRLLLIFLIAVIDLSSCQLWGDPLFTDEETHEKVKFDAPVLSRQTIGMDEEIPPDYIIAKINYKPKGATDIPKIGIFQENTAPSYLGAKLQKHEDEYYYIYITQKQDYEQPDMRRYVFDIEIEGFKKATIYLNILNIDDNFPRIEVSQCTIPELQTESTDCFFKVSDVDGPISINNMTFKIRGNSDEHNLFDVITTDKSTHDMTIQLLNKENLDFYENQLHIFTLSATDSGPNESNSSVIVKVKDIPNRPPEWRKVYAVLEFEEKEFNTFNVSAVDGDTEINEKILYRFDDQKYIEYFMVDEQTGLVTVKPIDRDEEENEIFEYELIAYKESNFSWTTPTTGIIYIKDKNDQTPDFNFLKFTTEIEEEKYLNLEFEYSIICHDKDLGENAQYTVNFTTHPEKLKDAFQVVPEAGYQRQEFKLVISNASFLDFDDTSFDDITIEITSYERFLESHTNKTTITIKLLNWNDEEPIFDPPNHAVEISETVGAGYFITKMNCSDRDIDDDLVYSISGNTKSFLDIDKDGNIFVKVDGAFDYHRQNEIYVQVLATDTLGDGPWHTSSAQLIINLLDANNRPPQIVMPRTVISVAENVPKDYLIPDALISGSDLDTTANLKFSINWDASYATKPGKKVENSTFIGCVDILTEPGDGHGKVIGKLIVKEIKENHTIDYEAFEILHLSIRLTDFGQSEGINFTEAILPITIEDVNDNPPVWVDGTLEIIRIVREQADTGVVIGNVRATDIDGPEFNVVRYMIEPTEERFKDLVMIDENGQLTVNKARAIDADVPHTDHLTYYIYATDCKENQVPSENICFKTSQEIIKINIIDTNNKIPYALEEEFNTETSIEEHSDFNTCIMIIQSKDLDRDEPFHNVSYSIDFRLQSEIQNLFKIEAHTGRLLVDGDLERDKGTTKHSIEITLTDNNYGASASDTNKNQNNITVTVVLIDINDNPPLFIEDYEWKISENTKEGVALSPVVIAEDIDEGENALVKYNMTLTPVDPDRPEFETFLMMDSPDNVSGIISTTKNLKGSWGTYDIFIVAYDLGKDPQASNGTFKLTVTPYNYEEPKFSFPTEGDTLRLHKELAQVGQTLKYTNQKDLENFVAIDPDGKEAGKVDFTIMGSENAIEYLSIIPINDKECKLILNKPLENISTFEITLLATDNGVEPHSKNSTINFTVRFIPMNGEPYFSPTEASGNLTEFEKGMDEHIPLKPAFNPKSEACTFAECEIEKIYYFFKDDPMKELFILDPVENDIMKLRLKKPLNRTEAESHRVRIVTSYRSDPSINPDPSAILTVDVTVKDHDPRPVFKQPLYVAGVGNSININSRILQVEATHTENLMMTFKIDKIETTHNSIANLKDPFSLDAKSGEMKIHFQPADYMMGKFIIDVIAEDEKEETGETQVNVFLIALDNKVYFMFKNNSKDIGEKRETIERIFSEVFGYKCNTDNIASVEQSNDKTEMVTYFVDLDSLPLDAIIIDTKKNDPRLMEKLNMDLLAEDINLEGFGSNRGNAAESLEEVLKIILIVVTTVLGILCIVLLITYCVQTRSLKNQLGKLTEKSFTPRPSDANGFGSRKLVPVPGTNIHAIEGSNPVFNEVGRSLNFDTRSESGSGDSELIGIEDNPQFYYGDKY